MQCNFAGRLNTAEKNPNVSMLANAVHQTMLLCLEYGFLYESQPKLFKWA